MSERGLRMQDLVGVVDRVGVCVTAPLTLLFEAHEQLCLEPPLVEPVATGLVGVPMPRLGATHELPVHNLGA